MTHAPCTAAVSPQDLLAYWLGELDDAHEQRLDEHLLACAACSERLGGIVDLGAAIRGELLRGNGFGFVLPAGFIRRVRQAGLRVCEYALEPGGSVNCTITPAVDIVASYLYAPLHDVHRLDIVMHDATAGALRASDVAFDPEAGVVGYVPSTSLLRAMGVARLRVELVAVDGAGERVIAGYTFDHSPS